MTKDSPLPPEKDTRYPGFEEGPNRHVSEVVKPKDEAKSEPQDESIEAPLSGRGAGVIFHIRDSDQFMFFLRDDKDTIPFPNMIDILGGHMEEGEEPEEAALRELAEELDDLDTGKPFTPTGLILFKRYVDDRNVEQNIFGCELETMPNLRLNEGQQLVVLNRDELASTEFAFGFKEIVQQYAATLE